QWTPETNVWNTIGSARTYSTPNKYLGVTNLLFRNEGNGRFTDVTKMAGLCDPEGKSMSVAVDDFNDDGWPDLFITNDTERNLLYMNQEDGTFVERGLTAGVAYDADGVTRAGMGVGVSDIDNSGARAIAIGNFSGEPVTLYTQQTKEAFIDKAMTARLSKPTKLSLTFGVLFADFNLDGYEDLIFANGHIEPEIERVRSDWEFAQLPQLFLNNRQSQFVEITSQAGAPFQKKMVGRCVAVADIDGDGDLDVLLTANGGAPRLLRNDQPGAPGVVRVRLASDGGNRDALGACLRAHVGDQVQTRFVRTGGSYLSQSELAVTFGLGEAAAIDQLDIRWPDGSVEHHQDLGRGSLYVIKKGEGIVARQALAAGSRAVARSDRGSSDIP
ncbi:MAG TPA: CRTAC1 family protein, partial [Phycisphaerae bacterium]